MSGGNPLPAPRVSVVIPAKDRARELDATLDALFRSDYRSFEVVVVDDGSTDDTAAVASRHGGRLVRHPECRGAAAARNTGARAARGGILLFIDSDVMVPPGLLAEVDRAFADPRTEALTGLLAKDAAHANFASQYDALYMHYQYWTHPPDFNVFYTSCAAIGRDLFLRHGGFDESYTGAGIEDMELGQRLRREGVRLLIHKPLQVTHAHRFSARELLLKNRRTAAGTLKIMLRNARAGHRSPRLVAPRWSFLLGIPLTWLAVLALLVTPVWAGAAAIAAPCAILVLALNRAFLAFLWSERGTGFLARSVGFLFLNYVFYGLGILGGAASFLLGSRY